MSQSRTDVPGGPQPPAVPPPEPPPAPPGERPLISDEAPRAKRDALNRRDLGPLLDDALSRIERRAKGDERPIPLPWNNVTTALGGGFWGGTLITLLGDTGSGKTQWALQAAVHAAESGVPVCYVASETGADEIASRLFALKAGEGWSDLYAGRTSPETLERLRTTFAEQMKALPFQVAASRFTPDRPPDIRALAEGTRDRYPEEKRGIRPILIALDFAQLVGAGSANREDLERMIRGLADDAHQVARDFGAGVLLVSTTSRQPRLDQDDTIGIHRDRRAPVPLGRGNPARLVRNCKDSREVQCESDTVLVLAQDSWKRAPHPKRWTRVWCAIAKNRAGSRGWRALRFDGTRFEEDTEVPTSPLPEPPAGEEGRRSPGPLLSEEQ